MAIILPSGFNITSKESVDARLTLTKAEMYAFPKAAMPDNYVCVCKDDGKLYIYNSNNEKLPEVGRFVLLEDQFDLEGEKIKANLDKAVADNIESGSESTKVAVQNVVNEAIGLVKVDGGDIEVPEDE